MTRGDFSSLRIASGSVRLWRPDYFSLLVQREVAKRNDTLRRRPSRHRRDGFPAVLAASGPPNNSAIHGLGQFGFPPLPAPLLGVFEGREDQRQKPNQSRNFGLRGFL